GVLTIDGDQRKRAQVDPLGGLGGLYVERYGGGLVEHFGRELVRNVVTVDRRLHGQRGGQLVAQHGKDAAQRRPARVGRAGQFADHQVAGLRVAAGFRRNQDVALDATVVGLDVAHAVI